jgi:hypothetical protein
MHPQDEVAISAAADAMSPGRAEDVLSGTTESPRTVVGDLPGRRGSGSGFGSESGTGMHWDHTGPGGIGIGLGGTRRRSSRANSRGGKAGGALARMRDVFGGSRKMMRLPEGVEGVFEPSMGGTRLQGGQSVSQVCSVYRAVRRGRGSGFLLCGAEQARALGWGWSFLASLASLASLIDLVIVVIVAIVVIVDLSAKLTGMDNSAGRGGRRRPHNRWAFGPMVLRRAITESLPQSSHSTRLHST